MRADAFIGRSIAIVRLLAVATRADSLCSAGDSRGGRHAQEVDVGPGRASTACRSSRSTRISASASGRPSCAGSDVAPRASGAPGRPGRSGLCVARRSSTRRSPTRARTASTSSLLVMGTPAWANGGRSRRAGRRARRATTPIPDRGRAPLSGGAPLDDLGRADQGVELPAAAHGSRAAADGPRPARPAHLRAHARRARTARSKAVSPANLVIGGNTFTVGTVSPRRWIQALRLPERPAAAHGPVRPQPVHARGARCSRSAPLGRGYADFGDLDTLARLARPRPAGREARRRQAQAVPVGDQLPDRPRELRVQLLRDAARPRRRGSRTRCVTRAAGRASTRSATSGSTTTRCGRTASRWSAG